MKSPLNTFRDAGGAAVLAAAALTLWLGAAEPVLIKTPGEETRYTEYTQNEAIGRFLSEADALAKELSVRVVGRSANVAEYAGRELFLAVLTEEGVTRPEDLNRKKPTLLITAAQHGNEQSAKEAALGLIRDLALGEMKPLLARMNVLVMPQTNPYGNFFDVRRNETGLDMNRDHIKLEAAGVEAIHRVFREWMPEVTVDAHEKGFGYYMVNIGCVSNPNISRVLQDYSRRTILGEVETALKKKAVTFHEYLVTEEMGSTGAAGVETAGPAGQAPPEEFTRYSTTDLNDGRNSLGIFETLSFIQEISSRHDLKTLETRTRWQYLGLRALMESAAGHGTEILKLVRDLRTQVLEESRGGEEAAAACLRMDFARDPQEPTLTLQKFERVSPPIEGILKVDKKAGETFTAAEVAPYPDPPGLKVVTDVIKNWFPDVVCRTSVPSPVGYIIPGGHGDVVENLLRLGVDVQIFIQDKTLEVEASTAGELVPAAADYLAPKRITVTRQTLSTVARSGDFYVPCAQPAGHLIPCLLEPESEFGFIRYWKYGLVPKPGDMFAVLRVTKPQVMRLAPYKSWPR